MPRKLVNRRGSDKPMKNWAPKDHINKRLVQTAISAIPLMLRLWNPNLRSLRVVAAFWALKCKKNSSSGLWAPILKVVFKGIFMGL